LSFPRLEIPGQPRILNPVDGISLVIPFYNEEQVLRTTAEAVWVFLGELRRPFELLLGDDGSTDGSYRIAQEFQKRHPDYCRLVRNPQNRGRGSILSQAFSRAQMPIVAYIDADLEIGLDHLRALIRTFDDPATMVCTGSKLLQTDAASRSYRRKFATLTLNFLIHTFLHSPLTDHQCGLKGFRKNFLSTLLLKTQETGWAFDTEILLLAQKEGARVREIPVTLQASRPSKVSFLATVFHFFQKIAEFRFRGLVL